MGINKHSLKIRTLTIIPCYNEEVIIGSFDYSFDSNVYRFNVECPARYN
jgi:hypothetical protein